MCIPSFQFNEMPALNELRTEQARQIWRAFSAMTLSCQKIERIYYKFCCVLVDKKVTIGNGVSSIQKAADTKIIQSSLARALSQPTSFKVQIFFHLLILGGDNIAKKLPLLHVFRMPGCASASRSNMCCLPEALAPGRLGWGPCRRRCKLTYCTTVV